MYSDPTVDVAGGGRVRVEASAMPEVWLAQMAERSEGAAAAARLEGAARGRQLRQQAAWAEAERTAEVWQRQQATIDMRRGLDAQVAAKKHVRAAAAREDMLRRAEAVGSYGGGSADGQRGGRGGGGGGSSEGGRASDGGGGAQQPTQQGLRHGPSSAYHKCRGSSPGRLGKGAGGLAPLLVVRVHRSGLVPPVSGGGGYAAGSGAYGTYPVVERITATPQLRRSRAYAAAVAATAVASASPAAAARGGSGGHGGHGGDHRRQRTQQEP